jgi:hypothetical protein
MDGRRAARRRGASCALRKSQMARTHYRWEWQLTTDSATSSRNSMFSARRSSQRRVRLRLPGWFVANADQISAGHGLYQTKGCSSKAAGSRITWPDGLCLAWKGGGGLGLGGWELGRGRRNGCLFRLVPRSVRTRQIRILIRSCSMVHGF